MNAEEIAALALDAGEGVASILAAVPDPAVRAGGTIAVGLIKAIRALTSSMGPEKAAAVIRSMAETSHAITPEDLAGDDAELAAKVRKLIAERDGAPVQVRAAMAGLVASSTIIVNGRSMPAGTRHITYADAVRLARAAPGATVTWRGRPGGSGETRAGELVPGDSVEAWPGLVINVADTSGA